MRTLLLIALLSTLALADYQPYPNPTTSTAPTTGGAGLQYE